MKNSEQGMTGYPAHLYYLLYTIYTFIRQDVNSASFLAGLLAAGYPVLGRVDRISGIRCPNILGDICQDFLQPDKKQKIQIGQNLIILIVLISSFQVQYPKLSDIRPSTC